MSSILWSSEVLGKKSQVPFCLYTRLIECTSLSEVNILGGVYHLFMSVVPSGGGEGLDLRVPLRRQPAVQFQHPLHQHGRLAAKQPYLDSLSKSGLEWNWAILFKQRLQFIKSS